MNINPANLMRSMLACLHADSGIAAICKGTTGGEPFVIRMADRVCVGILAVELRESVEFGQMLSTDIQTWLSDLSMFVTEGGNAIGYRDRFFRKTAAPLLQADELLNDHQNPFRKKAALVKAASMADSPWKSAMLQWINQQPEPKNEQHA